MISFCNAKNFFLFHPGYTLQTVQSVRQCCAVRHMTLSIHSACLERGNPACRLTFPVYGALAAAACLLSCTLLASCGPSVGCCSDKGGCGAVGVAAPMCLMRGPIVPTTARTGLKVNMSERQASPIVAGHGWRQVARHALQVWTDTGVDGENLAGLAHTRSRVQPDRNRWRRPVGWGLRHSEVSYNRYSPRTAAPPLHSGDTGHGNCRFRLEGDPMVCQTR